MEHYIETHPQYAQKNIGRERSKNYAEKQNTMAYHWIK